MNIFKIVLMRCLPGSLSSRTARWLFYSHTSPRGGDTHTCLNSSGVFSPRACSLPAAHRPELACRDTERRALGGKKPQYTQLKQKRNFLEGQSNASSRKEEKRRRRDAVNESSNNLMLWLLGLWLLDPLLLPGRFGSSP